MPTLTDSGKRLDDASQTKLRSLVREIIQEAGGQKPAAAQLGVSQGYLSEFLSGSRGGGSKLLRGLATLKPSAFADAMGIPRSAPDHLWAEVRPALKKNIGPKKLFTVERIARAVGVDEDTVRAWLKDEERPTTSNLTRIVQILSNHEGALPQPLIDRFYSPIDPRAPYSLPTDRQVLTVSDPRYSNREQAIALLVQDGRGDEATIREAADRAAVALDADDDAPVLRWVEMIGPFIRSAKTGTDKALGERELEDDD